MPNVSKTLVPIYIPGAPEKLLAPRSAEYFKETREKRFGMPYFQSINATWPLLRLIMWKIELR